MVLRKRPKTAKYDINRLFKNSMVTGIPQIIEATNWKKKITRSLVFVICMLGFIYQSLEFMKIYWKYETVVDVQVYSPIEIDKPAFTVCGEVGFMSSKFCPTVTKEFSQETGVTCEAVKNNKFEDFCFCHPRLCTLDKGVKNISLITFESWEWISEQPWNWLKNYSATEREYVESCDYTNVDPDNDHSNDCKYDNSVSVPCYRGLIPPSCFTRDSLYENPDGKPEKVLSFGEMYLTLRTLEMEVPLYVKDPRMFISFHAPHTIENPMVKGFILEREHRYKFRLSKVIKKLLPFPYETDCIDYLEIWKARGGKGPTNLSECIQECLRNRSIEVYGCVKDGINYPGFDIRCQPGVHDNGLFLSSQECIKECKPACYEEYYVTTSVGSQETELSGCFSPEIGKGREDYTTIEILYSGMETTVYTYSPKYQDIEIFSYIGGYVGMWLGISLIAIFDFLETMVMLMQYPLRSLRHLKEKSKVNQFKDGINSLY